MKSIAPLIAARETLALVQVEPRLVDTGDRPFAFGRLERSELVGSSSLKRGIIVALWVAESLLPQAATNSEDAIAALISALLHTDIKTVPLYLEALPRQVGSRCPQEKYALEMATRG